MFGLVPKIGVLRISFKCQDLTRYVQKMHNFGMSRVLPPLNALRAFDAAGRHGSFSRAAEELNVSHSAISRHVRGLESRLGAQLFRSDGQGVALTPDGQAYLARISPALDDIADATENYGDAPTGRVVVNSDPQFAEQVIAPNLGAFWSMYPELELRLIGSNLLADVDRYEADFAVRFSAAGRLDRPADLISDAPLFPYAAPGFLAPRPGITDILNARRVQDRPAEVWQRWAAAMGHDLGPQAAPAWRLKSPLATAAARGGGAVLLGSAESVNAMCKAGALQRLWPVPFHEGAFYLVANETQLRRKALRVVRDWLLDITSRFRGQAFWDIDQPIG
jgi:LysR family glycine cleavage system transcriptional activator